MSPARPDLSQYVIVKDRRLAPADGWLPMRAEEKPYRFGYRRVRETKDVPCPNCGAPNERNGWLSPSRYFTSWFADDGAQAFYEALNKGHDYEGQHILDHWSRFEVAHCRYCGGQVMAFGWPRPGKKAVWFYKPAPVGEYHLPDFDAIRQQPVWFDYGRGEDGQIQKAGQFSPWSMDDLLNAGAVFQNIHTSSVDHVVSIVVDDFWHPHLVGSQSILVDSGCVLGIGLYREERGYCIEHATRIDTEPDFTGILDARIAVCRDTGEAKTLKALADRYGLPCANLVEIATERGRMKAWRASKTQPKKPAGKYQQLRLL